MNLLIALVIGLMAGAHSATWGMYKDAIYEGFTYRKYFRSIFLSAFVAILFQLVTQFEVNRPGCMLVLFGVTYVVERAILEFYKTFLREEDQSKYFIPMQLHVFGKVVESRRTRWMAGVVYLGVVSLAVVGIKALQDSDLYLPAWLVVLLIGSIGGWISALGGAWKDAPIEGFETLKFFRSPLIALSYALLLACFTQSYLYIAMGGLGYTIGTIETYKTFGFPNKPRGKFAGKEVRYPEMLKKRERLVPLYLAIWVTVIGTVVIAFFQPREGLVG